MFHIQKDFFVKKMLFNLFSTLFFQNQKLVQQLREKDEANLKLMAERIRTNQVLKKMKEEKDTLDQAFTGLENLTAAKDLLIKKLEEKERALSENRSTLEQELRCVCD